MNIEKNTKEKIDIIVNLPSFNEFLNDCYYKGELSLNQIHFIYDYPPVDGGDITLDKFHIEN